MTAITALSDTAQTFQLTETNTQHPTPNTQNNILTGMVV